MGLLDDILDCEENPRIITDKDTENKSILSSPHIQNKNNTEKLRVLNEDIVIEGRKMLRLCSNIIPDLVQCNLTPLQLSHLILLLSSHEYTEEFSTKEGDRKEALLRSSIPEFNRETSNALLLVLSTAQGPPWSAAQNTTLQEARNVAEHVRLLDNERVALTTTLEETASQQAPALSELVGTQIAAGLLAAGGGLEGLARVPADRLALVGSGYSNDRRQGLLAQTALVAPLLSQGLAGEGAALRRLANSVALAIRADLANIPRNESPSPEAITRAKTTGIKLRERLLDQLSSLYSPPTLPKEKPIRAPDMTSRPHRAGKRYKGKTEARRLAVAIAESSKIPMDGMSDPAEPYKGKFDSNIRTQIARYNIKMTERRKEKLSKQGKNKKKKGEDLITPTLNVDIKKGDTDAINELLYGKK